MSNHTNSEFIIDLVDRHPTFDKFKSALNREGLGDQFEDSFISNLLRLIQRMRPPAKVTETERNEDFILTSDLNQTSKEELRKKCPALGMPDEDRSATTEKLMRELEQLYPKWKDEEETTTAPVISPVKTPLRGDRHRRSPSRSRSRDRNERRRRSRSPDDRKRRRRSTSRDDDRKRRNRSPRDRDGRSGGRRRSRSRDRGRQERDREPRKEYKPLSDKPTDGQIYDGRVANITGFGAFVQMMGLAQKVEGLVHISHIQNERVQSVGDVLTRGQMVKVKVGGKLYFAHTPSCCRC